MPRRETQTQFVARHARFQLAKSVLEHTANTKENPVRQLTRIKLMMAEIVERDGHGF